MSSLGYALLGLLAREPLSGYDIKQRMGRRVGNFWSASHGQIYPELARLEGEGMVAHSVVEQRERPDKKVYEITASGRDALKAWVTEPPPARAARDELVLKAYSLWLADPREGLRLFEEQGRAHEEQLLRYEETKSWMEREWGEDLDRADSPHFASYAALRRGILYERGYVEWCSWLADRLRDEAAQRTTGTGRPGGR